MENTIKSCCFTGYRPEKFPFELKANNPDYIKFDNKLIDAVFSLPREGCTTFYCGMAMGFDIIAAEAVVLLKKSLKDQKIKLVCVIPFRGQAQKYTEEWRKRFNEVLCCADEIMCLSDDYYRGCFQKRNEYMIDRSDIVITWFDGKKGGTANTLKYAEKKQKRIVNLFEEGSHEYYARYNFIAEK